jgi:hypothetical protein
MAEQTARASNQKMVSDGGLGGKGEWYARLREGK